ncbi:S26 family signal peptidase [Polymorphospora sp. NPDC050346]|uniref:S26 family signal peptidase n=1 Tax=Polymorphospora sp. NPDC050346 TaxID=3155780 RepID=UPI0033CED58F
MPVTLVLISTALLAIWWLRRRFVVVTVTGPSMLPTLRHGDSLLVRRTRVGGLRHGVVVVLELPPQAAAPDAPAAPDGADRWSVKRVVGLPGDVTAGIDGANRPVPAGCLAVAGDNVAVSYDSRHVGPVRGDRLLGVVVRRLRTADGEVAPAP